MKKKIKYYNLLKAYDKQIIAKMFNDNERSFGMHIAVVNQFKFVIILK